MFSSKDGGGNLILYMKEHQESQFAGPAVDGGVVGRIVGLAAVASVNQRGGWTPTLHLPESFESCRTGNTCKCVLASSVNMSNLLP